MFYQHEIDQLALDIENDRKDIIEANIEHTIHKTERLADYLDEPLLDIVE